MKIKRHCNHIYLSKGICDNMLLSGDKMDFCEELLNELQMEKLSEADTMGGT